MCASFLPALDKVWPDDRQKTASLPPQNVFLTVDEILNGSLKDIFVFVGFRFYERVTLLHPVSVPTGRYRRAGIDVFGEYPL